MDNRCNVSFQSKYAKKNGDLINIDIFLEGNNDNTDLVCIPHGHELIPVRCTKRHPHFRHKHASDLTGSPMTQWHSEWQSNFPVTEVPFNKKPGQIKDRRADIVLPEFSHIIEIQHSKIWK